MSDKVNILGTDYAIRVEDYDADRKLESNVAYVELYAKEIVLKRMDEDCHTVKRFEHFKRDVLLHEIVHAFFHESGMSEWCEDEALVDWVALMLPKLVKAAQDAGALSEVT